MNSHTDPTGARITRDTPVGYELQSIKKKAVIQLMGSRLWGRFNPNHWDATYARATGLTAPIQTGEMSSAYLAEMCVESFRRADVQGRADRLQICRLHPGRRDHHDPRHGAREDRERALAIASSSTSGPTTRRAKNGRSAGSKSMSASDRNTEQGRSSMTSETARDDSLRPQTEIQSAQTRIFIEGLEAGAQTYWDMVEIGDELSRELEITPELVILYADAVEDFNPWYEGWRMNSWRIPGESPFGGAIVPPVMLSHFVLSVQFDHTKPFAIGSIHTFHDSEILAPIPVGATVTIATRAIGQIREARPPLRAA